MPYTDPRTPSGDAGRRTRGDPRLRDGEMARIATSARAVCLAGARALRRFRPHGLRGHRGSARVPSSSIAVPARGDRGTDPKPLPPRHDSMAEALLLGRRERMDPAVRERFTRAGLVHLLAISGTHVGLLAGVVLIAGAILRMPRRRLTWATLGLTWVYLLMIGAPASAIRAGLMLSLALLALLLQRPSAALPMIAAAGLLLLAIDPRAILDPGFQLSFAGVGAIILVLHAVNPLVPGSWKRIRSVRWLVESMLVSAAAFVATAPITAHHFGTVAPIAIVANIPALPLMSLALVGVLSATLLHPLLPPLARLCADGAGLAFDLLDRVALVAAAMPLASVDGEPSRLARLVGGCFCGCSGRVFRPPRAHPHPPRARHRRCGSAAHRLARFRPRRHRLPRAALPGRGAGRRHGHPHSPWPLDPDRRGTERAGLRCRRAACPPLFARPWGKQHRVDDPYPSPPRPHRRRARCDPRHAGAPT
jgi:ComEC/Rec2-related protein